MDSFKKLMDVMVEERPSEEELNKFSAELSDLIGSQNPYRLAYFVCILKQYVKVMEESEAVMPVCIDIAEKLIETQAAIIRR